MFEKKPKKTVKKIQRDEVQMEIELDDQEEKMEIDFDAGDLEDKELEVTVFDQTPPAEVREVRIPEKAAMYFEVKTDIEEETFSAALRVPFNSSLLTRANIRNKRRLTLARFLAADSVWQKVPTEIDTVSNIAIAIINRFSIWTLMDEEYFEPEDVPVDERIYPKDDAIIITVSDDPSISTIKFENDATIGITFLSGAVADKEVSITQFSLPGTPAFNNWLYYFNLSMNESNFTAELTFGYSDSVLNLRGIAEDSLAVAFFGSTDDRGEIWHSLPVSIDKANNTLTVTTSHFSTWLITTREADFITDVMDEESQIPEEVSLSQNFPNPFNPVTAIRYQIPSDQHVRLDLYNVLGKLVRVLVDDDQNTGRYTIHWDGKNEYGASVSSGIYFYRLRAGNYNETKKMLLIR